MIGWFVHHQTAANLLMAAIVILGLTTLPELQRETLPELENDQVQVQITYRGAAPQEIEAAICRRLEDAIETVPDLEELRCEAREGVGIATAVMREGAEIMRFLDGIKAGVDGIDDLPEETEPPVISEIGRTDAVVALAVTGPADVLALKAYAEDLKTRLLAETEAAEVQVTGFSDHHIRIEIPAWRLRQYGLSAAHIADAIGRQSLSTPAGRLEGGQENLLLRFEDQRKHADAFRDLVVISGKTGAAIRLGEIASITDRFDRDEEKILFNGRRAALLSINKTRDQDILELSAQVRAFVDAELAKAPSGVAIHLSQDLAPLVQDRLDMLVRNGAQGLTLVLLTLWLVFGLRYSFWVALGLPISFLGALFLMPAFGITINMISMVGLLIGVGLLMDDAIVIAENIAARRAAGDSPADAAINGSREVLPGVLSSFTTTLLVFGSLAFISGEFGQILRVLPIVLILVISVSLLEAFLILPNHLSHALNHTRQGQPNQLRKRLEEGVTRLRDSAFGRLLDWAIDYRYLTVGLALMLFILSVAMPAAGKLKFVGFPDVDGDIIEARVLLPQGTPLARTEAVVAQIKAGLETVGAGLRDRQAEGRELIQAVTVIHGQNPDAYERGAHVARVVVDLLGAAERDMPLDEVLNMWRQAVGTLPDVVSIKYVEPAIGFRGRPIDLRLVGSDLEQLKAASRELLAWLSGFAGVQDLSDDLRPGKREYRIRLKPNAGVLGLDARQVAEQLRAAFHGVKIDEFPLGAETYEVNLRLAAADRSGPADLDRFSITGPGGTLIPLPAVAESESARGWARIHRIDGQRAVSVQGDVDHTRANAQEVLAMTRSELLPGLLERYPGVRLDVVGESKESAETSTSIARNALLGLIGVYMLLALQFRSYLVPITVMTVIPTTLIGVVFGHLLMGLDLTMPSIVGMASLFGVVVNNSILLVFFIRQACQGGLPVINAAKRAARARFRPILLTSITTIAGLLPLLLEKSLQAQILIPLAASIAFGLATATIAALFLVPAIYCILNDFGALKIAQTEGEHVAA